MLVLTRKLDEQILIGDDIKVTLIRVRGNTVRIGIDAPKDIRIVRGELKPLAEASHDDGVEAGFEEGALSEREHAFAHPAMGKVNLPTKGPTKGPAKGSRRAVASRSKKADAPRHAPRHASRLSVNVDRIAAEVNAEVFVGTVKASGEQPKVQRAPLANFVSAS